MENDGKVEPRYMTSTKKHYYLASENQNVQQLIKEEIDGLTRVLIDLKSQYDIIRRASLEKEGQIDELSKKIDSLQLMEKDAIKIIGDTNQKSENLSNLIKAKQTQLNEGHYLLKTLRGTLSKLKKDSFIVQKRMMTNENITTKLMNDYQKEHFKKTLLKTKKNKVFSDITNQQKKNNFEKDEHNLQLQYFRTIIEQKNTFIKSDDERKERQKKIAEEAKNSSADQQEVERRKILGILKLYNMYLTREMDKSLKQNEQLEVTYREIREICGSPSLKLIVDKILTKETRYNESLSKINELQDQIDIYDQDIKELENKLKILKNEVLVEEKNDKTIDTISSNIIQDNETQLIKEEKDLMKEDQLLSEKLIDINLTYNKILENIQFFIDEYKNEGKNESEVKVIKKKYNLEDTNENFYQQATATGQSSNYDPQSLTSTRINFGNSRQKKKTLINRISNEYNNMIFTTDNVCKDNKTGVKFYSRGSTPKVKIFDEFKIKAEKKEEDEESKAPTVKDKNYNQNNLIQGFNKEEDSIFDNLVNTSELIKEYNKYLIWLSKKFDRFFLCYNKEQFKAVMAEKGISSQLNRIDKIRKADGTELTHKYQKRKVTKKGDAIKRVVKLHTDNIIKEEKVKNKVITHEVVEDEDDIEVKPQDQNQNGKFRRRHKGPSNDIFIRFLEEQENKNNEFIHEKELLKRNRK